MFADQQNESSSNARSILLYDLSLRKAMDAVRFFSLVDLPSFSSTCDFFSHDVIGRP